MPIAFEIQQGLPFVFTNLPNLLYKGQQFEPQLRRSFTPNLVGPRQLSWCIIGTTSQSVHELYVTTYDKVAHY